MITKFIGCYAFLLLRVLDVNSLGDLKAVEDVFVE